MVRNIIGNYIAVSITFLKNFFPPAFEIEKERERERERCPMGFRNRRAPSRPPMGDVIGSEHGHEPILDSQKYKNQLEPHEFF